MRLRFKSLLPLLLGGAGCGGVASPPADAASTPSTDVISDLASPRFDTGPQQACALGGTGRLRVGVALAPELEPRTPEVWLAARCGDEPFELRLVRWDRSASMVLDGFGPGMYEIFASSFVGAPTTSARATVDPSSTVSLSVTLAATPPLLAALSGGGSGLAIDGGAPASRDAGLAETDAAVLPVWTARTHIIDSVSGASLANVEVEARPTELVPDDRDNSRITVRAVVRGVCTATPLMPCPQLTLHAAEVRTLDNERPWGVGTSNFVSNRVAPGDAVALQRPVLLRGALPDARSVVRVAVYGSIGAPTAAGMRP